MTGTTRSGQLYHRLREDILSGCYPPGSKLPFARLTAVYDSSSGSLREVLQRLVETGLVETVAQQGFRVVPLTIDDLQDLTVARLEIELAAFRHAIADGDTSWEAAVLSTHHVLDRTPKTEQPGADRITRSWSIAHTTFHQTLIAGCANRRLRAAAESLRGVAELYRTWSFRYEPDSARDTAEEHRALAGAVIARDPERAVDLLRQHIELTSYHLIPVLEAMLPGSGVEEGLLRPTRVRSG